MTESGEGIFKQMGQNYRMNPHQAGLVRVTASCVNPMSTLHVYELIDPFRSGVWMSIPKAEVWINFDFLTRRVNLVGYKLTFPRTPVYAPLPDNWALFGSPDGLSWFIIDEQRNPVIENREIVVSVVTRSKVKEIKFCSAGKETFSLARVEFFGDVENRV